MAKQPGLGERTCPKCKEIIKADALICKHCRTEFTPEEMAQAKKDQHYNNKLAGFGCLGLVLALGFCTYTMGGDEKTSQDIPEKPAATAKTDATTFYRNIMGALSSCDEAGKRMASAGASSDVVGTYQAASAMESACLGAPTAIRSVEVPVGVGKAAHAKLTETREVCEHAYLAKWSSAGKMKEALDEGGVAKLAALKEQAEMAQAGTLACAAGLVGQAMELGATGQDLKVSR